MTGVQTCALPIYTLDRALDVRENLYFHGRFFGMSAKESRREADRLLEVFRLTERASAPVLALSGGMAQRLMVARSIVQRQAAFLEQGEEAMQPMILRDVAEAVGMHESTISRVTTGKYMHTPRGIFELKYFFSSHVSTDQGGEASSTAIRAVIKKLIAAEACDKPLSDSKIATILTRQGINVARRTVAKYREGMQIPPSNERKRLG